MPRRTPKRRRSVAFPEQEDAQESVAEETQTSGGPDKPIDITDNADNSAPHAEGEEGNMDDAPLLTEKEQEIWESFREEYFEVLEQLPLSLHREFALILELDQQVSDYNNALRTAAGKYIVKRRAIAAKHRKQPDVTEQPMQVEEPQSGEQMAATTATEQQDIQNVPDEPMLQDSTAADSSQLALSTESQEGAPPEPEEEPPESNRELLTTIAQMSEGIVRASSEKVNVARHAYDLIDRYIRDLDRAIKEEETSLLVGLRPGTHPASIILPEVVVPTLKTHRRRTSTPVPEGLALGTGTGAGAEVPVPDGDVVMADETNLNGNTNMSAHANMNASSKPPSKRKSSRTRRDISGASGVSGATSNGNGKDEKEEVAPPVTAAVTRKVRLTLRSQADDTEEEKWCYCHQGSYGNMIACDNKSCKLEWFHFGCVGLAEDYTPKGKWYCRECAPLFQKKGKSR